MVDFVSRKATVISQKTSVPLEVCPRFVHGRISNEFLKVIYKRLYYIPQSVIKRHFCDVIMTMIVSNERVKLANEGTKNNNTTIVYKCVIS